MLRFCADFGGSDSYDFIYTGFEDLGYHRHMTVIHISDTDAAHELANAMARVYAGEEVVIENGKFAVAMVPASIPLRRSISECIALARKHEEETGESPVLDADFVVDVEEVIRNRKPWNPPTWD